MNRFVFFFLLLSLTTQICAINAPVLNSPANAASFSKFDNFLYVNAVTGAKGYQFQIDTLSNFSSQWLKTDTNTSNYIYSPELRIGKTYYWRARCYNGTDTSLWANYFTFSVINGVTTLSSPANNATGSIVNFRCASASTFSPVNYVFEVDTASNLSSVNKRTVTQSTYIFEDSILFSFGKTLYWRAKAYNSYGDTFSWSPTWKYTFHQMPVLNASTNLMMVDPKITPNWTNAGLSSIQLQADTSTSFNTSRLIEHILAPGVILDTLQNLLFGKDYFYRIRAVYKGKYSNWSFTASIRVYANGNINSPYNGATENTLTPNFGWRQLNGTRYQFQLYADSAKTILLKDTITQSNGYGYKNELKLNKWYNFRMRYLHDLDTAAWLSSNFKIYPGQVGLGAPNANATNVSVRPRLSFRKQTWATSHVLEIDTGTAFGSNQSSYFIRVVDSFKFDGSYYHFIDTTIAYGQKYVWRVYAIKDQDTAGASVRNFTTSFAPTNYFPQNNYIGVGTSTNGLITGITGSKHVQWQLDTVLTFDSPILKSGTDLHIPDDFSPQYVALNFPGDLLFHSKYFWRARCLNAIDTSSWSTPFNFITTQDVWLTSPANHATNIALNPKLEWGIQGSASELRYQYQLSKDSLFTSVAIVTLPANSSSNVTVTCEYGTQYYWRARAYHSQDTSRWSGFYAFKTLNAPTLGAVQLVTPANGANNVPVGSVTLGWNFLANALTYDVEVSDDQAFSAILASGNTTSNAIYFTGAQANTRYYWRVRGRINSLLGPWSTVRYFNTAPATGANEIGEKQSVKVYPNPASQSFNIELEGAFSIKIYDIQGKLIYEGQDTNSAEINSSNWFPGIYFLNIYKGSECFIQKIIVQ
jgi:hypothetical protein